jgi:WD40 repeat protein
VASLLISFIRNSEAPLMRTPHRYSRATILVVVLAIHGAINLVAGQSQQRESTAGSRIRPELVVQLGHTEYVSGAWFSPDGRLALTIGDNTPRLWDVVTSKEIRRFAGHTQTVLSAAFSSDGRMIATGSDDHTVRVWDAATGREIKRFESDDMGRNFVAFLSSDQMLITAGRSNTIQLWNVATGQQIRDFKFAERTTFFESAEVSSDGKLLLTCGGDPDNTAWLWDIETGKQIRQFRGQSSVLVVAISPDGKLALTGGGDKTARLWEVATGREIRQFKGQSFTVGDVGFSPDGRLAVTVCSDVDTYARLWDVETGKELKRFEHGDPIEAIEFSADGKMILTAGAVQNSARIWDVASGREIRKLESRSSSIEAISLPADGKIILAGIGNWSGDTQKTAWIWDATTGKQIVRLIGHSADVRAFAITPDGQKVVTGSGDNTARLWDAATGKELMRFTGHTAQVNVVTISADGRFVVTGGPDQTARLWDAASGKQIKQFNHADWVDAVAISPDGRTVLTTDGTARVWDAATGREIRKLVLKARPNEFTQNGEMALTSVTFSPDGKQIFTGVMGSNPPMWDAATGEIIKRFNSESDEDTNWVYDPEGRTLWSIDKNNRLQLWDLTMTRRIGELEGHQSGTHSLATSPDSRFVLTKNGDRTARLWDASTGRELCQMSTFEDGSWVVVDAEGRFDTNNLEEIRGLHWVMPDDPFTPVPLEIFMREYYEPRLLQRILQRETFRPVRSLLDLNRAQPKVVITKIESQQNDLSEVSVTVEVSKGTTRLQRAGKEMIQETGVYNLRLFRNGQLIGYAPDSDGEIKLDAQTGKAVIKFEHIRLPRKADVRQIEFSAYAFNLDRVKSVTDRKSIDVSRTQSPVKGRAYLITVGVNAYEQASFDLSFAANDARRFQTVMSERLSKTGDYSEIVQVPLISDYSFKNNERAVTEKSATKASIKAVLDLLAGKKISTEQAKEIPNADKIQQAKPEDLILISFSSHGFADDKGSFYFVPYDTGQVTAERVTKEFLSRCISSEELSFWLRDIDAGEMVMIVDACHSAATVDAEGFKPGPMGSRGLGQLAYDKGMRILTSTQADDVALESGLIKQGLLIYALINDGIESAQADFSPKDNSIAIAEWLSYGVERVPVLYEEIKKGEVQRFGRTDKRGLLIIAKDQKSLARKNPYQQPSLFDFAKNKREMVLVKPNAK